MTLNAACCVVACSCGEIVCDFGSAVRSTTNSSIWKLSTNLSLKDALRLDSQIFLNFIIRTIIISDEMIITNIFYRKPTNYVETLSKQAESKSIGYTAQDKRITRAAIVLSTPHRGVFTPHICRHPWIHTVNTPSSRVTRP